MPRLSLHSKGGESSLSLAVGLLLIAGGVAGGGFLLIDAVGGTADTRSLHAERTNQENQDGIPIPTAEARQEAPALVEALEAAASTGEAVLEDPRAVDRAVAFIHEQASGDAPRDPGADLPRDGTVLWEEFVIQLDLRTG